MREAQQACNKGPTACSRALFFPQGSRHFWNLNFPVLVFRSVRKTTKSGEIWPGQVYSANCHYHVKFCRNLGWLEVDHPFLSFLRCSATWSPRGFPTPREDNMCQRLTFREPLSHVAWAGSAKQATSFEVFGCLFGGCLFGVFQNDTKN